MISIDKILQFTSEDIFGLKNTHYRILKYIAKHGALSKTELGKMTSSRKFTYHPYKRWGVTSRLDGSNKYLGLIPNQYVYPIKINKKETKYALTLKGLCAVLAKMEFEKIFIVKEYRKYLSGFTKDKNMLKWSLDFIKYEIALVLFHNYLKGLNWKKYKQLRSYWNSFKQYDEKTKTAFFQDTSYLQEIGNYDEVKREYLKLFFILDSTTNKIEWGKEHDFESDTPHFSHHPIRKFVDRWHLFIDHIILQEKEWMEYDAIQPLAKTHNQSLWNDYQNELRKEAEIIVENTFKEKN